VEDEQTNHIREAKHRTGAKFDLLAVYRVQGGTTRQWSVVRNVTVCCAEQNAPQERLLDLSEAHLLGFALESRPSNGSESYHASN
jgi:hypothetical protein